MSDTSTLDKAKLWLSETFDEETRNKYVSNIVFGALHRTEI